MENALKICKHLCLALNENPCEGEIIYLDRFEMDVQSPLGIVRFFSEGVLRPYSCLVPSTVNFAQLSVSIGTKVFLGAEEVDINDADVEISLKLAAKVDLSVEALGLFLPMDLKQRFRYLQRAIELSDDKAYFSALVSGHSPVPYAINERLSKLSAAVKAENIQDILSAAKECAGLGEGRYPASDQLLCGYLQAFMAFSCSMGRKRENVQTLSMAILEGAVANTTQESGFLMWLASNGLSDEDGCQLFRGLFSDKSYSGLLACASASVSRNGPDWLIGVCAFLRYYSF